MPHIPYLIRWMPHRNNLAIRGGPTHFLSDQMNATQKQFSHQGGATHSLFDQMNATQKQLFIRGMPHSPLDWYCWHVTCRRVCIWLCGLMAQTVWHPWCHTWHSLTPMLPYMTHFDPNVVIHNTVWSPMISFITQADPHDVIHHTVWPPCCYIYSTQSNPMISYITKSDPHDIIYHTVLSPRSATIDIHRRDC